MRNNRNRKAAAKLNAITERKRTGIFNSWIPEKMFFLKLSGKLINTMIFYSGLELHDYEINLDRLEIEFSDISNKLINYYTKSD